MSSHMQRQDLTPPPLEEGYWEALLNEGEFTDTAHTHEETISEKNHDFEDFDGNYHTHPTEQSDWHTIKNIMDNDEIVEPTVIGFNRGGLLVEWHSLRGFVPASQLVNFPTTAPLNARRNALSDRIGERLSLRVIELNPDQNRLIFSERAARVEAGERAQILTRLQPGNRVRGTITNLCDFGAFVDLGGLEGLIHISELSWGRVGHPSDILHRGQDIEVYVLSVDRENARIALSLKRLHPDPWQTVAERYYVGQVVVGTITNVVDFGAFACIEEGLEGLIHVSELAEGHFLHPRNVVAEGQHVRTRILSIDSDARRLGLSLRLNP
jgi:small subunit ribosomal protein S1